MDVKTITIDGNSLSPRSVEAVARKNLKVLLSETAAIRVQQNRTFLEKKIKSGDTIYGVNTGFGFLANKKIDKNKARELQINLIRSHTVGVGEYLPVETVRAIMLLRANALARGFSGVRVELIKKILELLNKGVHPCIPIRGSVGASGDLAPLAHMALLLIGEGEATYRGKSLSGSAALEASRIDPIVLFEKEGLALINGTQFSTAITTLCFIDAQKLINLSDLAASMTLEAVKGSPKPFSKEIQDVRPHPGQIFTASRMRKLLSGSEIQKSHEKCDKIQDSYSFRCIPQVHGAIRDVLDYSERVLQIEINSSTDNPLVFHEQEKVLSGGNFHAEPVAFAADFMGIAISELANISERRIEKLMDPAHSGHPAFLAKEGGLNSGLMIAQVVAAALVSENKILASPASIDSIPTSANKEDHVSMSPIAATKLQKIIVNALDVLCIELLSAYQGLNLLLPQKPSTVVSKAFDIIGSRVKPIECDRALYKDLRIIRKLIADEPFFTTL